MNARNRGFLLPLLLVLAAGLTLAVDLPIAGPLKGWNTGQTDLDKTVHAYLGYLDMFEPFGHGLGVLLVVLVLHQLDPARRWAIPRLVTCALAGGGLADLLKMLILRTRPHSFGFDGSVWSTFGQWFPLFTGESGGQSFPSAHTATAAALAAALVWLYPVGWRLFIVLVVLVGCQRIASSAHYPTDVLFGAAAGCLVGQLWISVGFVPRWFERWESRWREK